MSKSSPKNLPKIHNAKVLFKRLMAYAWHYKWVFLISILSLIILSATNTGFLAAIKKITDQGFGNKNETQTLWLPFMLFGLMVVRAICGFVSFYSMRWIARHVVQQIRLDCFDKLMQLPVSFFDGQSAGVIVSKLTYDTERVSIVSTRVFLALMRDSFTAIGVFGYMLYLDWKLTLIFLLVAPIIALFLKNRTPKMRAKAREVQQSMGEVTKVAEEAISGQRIVKIFGAALFEFNRFASQVSTNRITEMRLSRISGLNSFVVEVLSAFALGLIIYYSVGHFTAGEFAAFVGALLMLISPIKSITSANEDLQVGLAAAQSTFDLIDTPAQLDEGMQTIARATGEITFKHASLQYDNAKSLALKDINVTIKSGEKVALVGRSGGGKSSLMNAIPRFYELQSGQILLDGLDVSSLTLHSLRAQFSLVSQDVVLFNDTVFNNIAYGDLRNSSEANVIKAAEAAHAWEFIQALPGGLQSEIGDRGVRLSGGQRQRLAIARAILKNAPILLLDEATSALDTESEKHVQAALDQLMKNRTTLVIAHRLSTIENADRILVLDHGEIVESGSHAELIGLNGHYAKLYHQHFDT